MAANFIPIFPEITQQPGVKLTDAAVFGAVWFYSFKGAGFCNKKPENIGAELGCSANTVRTSQKILIDLNLIEDLTPNVKHTTHKYRPTEAALSLLPNEDRLPNSGNLSDNLPEIGNQDLVTSLPEIGNQKPDRLPEFGNDKNSANKNNNNTLVSNETKGGEPPTIDEIISNPGNHSIAEIKGCKFTETQYNAILAIEQESDRPRVGLIKHIKTKLIENHPAWQMYRRKSEYYQVTTEWREEIVKQVGDKKDDVERWGRVVTDWCGISQNKGNIKKMLYYFNLNILPSQDNPFAKNGANYGQGRANQSKPTPTEPEEGTWAARRAAKLRAAGTT